MPVMTPLDFYMEYKCLKAYLFQPEPGAEPGYTLTPGWQELSVVKYRLGRSDWAATLWKDIATRIGESVTVRVKTLQRTVEDVTLTPSKAQAHFHYPFVGKGSPEQAQIAIQLTYRYHKTHKPPGQFVKQNFIGLDCNGFVGNYIQRAVRGQSWQHANNEADPGPTTLIGDLLEMQGRENRINDIKELSPGDTFLLGHCAGDGSILDPSKDNPKAWGHIMITQPGTLGTSPDGVSIGVVEATHAGKEELRSFTYTIRDSKKTPKGTVFNIWRGTGKDKGVIKDTDFFMTVRIARLKL